MHADARVWFFVALGFCVVGDVFLMLPRDAFVPGLAVAAALLASRFLRALLRHGQRSLVVPVVAYIVAIGTMLATAIGAGGAVGVAGAGLFFVSDAVIAETRFVRPRAWGPLVVIVSYHLALAGLVFSLVR